MGSEIGSSNPVVAAIVNETAPRAAQVAASRGILPLSQGDLLEALVHLAKGDDVELRENAKKFIGEQDARLIAINRQWARVYNVMHALAKNPLHSDGEYNEHSDKAPATRPRRAKQKPQRPGRRPSPGDAVTRNAGRQGLKEFRDATGLRVSHARTYK